MKMNLPLRSRRLSTLASLGCAILVSAAFCKAVDFEVHTAFGQVLQSSPTSSGSLTLKCAPGLVRTTKLNVINLSGTNLTGVSASFRGPAANQFVVAHPLPTEVPISHEFPLVVGFAPQTVMVDASCELIISANELPDGGFRMTLVGNSNVQGALFGVKEVSVGEKLPLPNAEVQLNASTPVHHRVTTGRLVVTNYGKADAVNVQLHAPNQVGEAAIISPRLVPGQSIEVEVPPLVDYPATTGVYTFTTKDGTTSYMLGVVLPTVVFNPGTITTGTTIGPGSLTVSSNVIIGGSLVLNQPVQQPVSLAVQWPLGDIDSGAVDGAAITGSSLSGFTGSGPLLITLKALPTGAPTYVSVAGSDPATKVGSTLGAHFDGASKLSTNLVLNAVDNFALECWARPTSSTGTRCIAHIGNPLLNGFGFYQVGSTLRARFGINSDIGQTSFTEGAWVHLALVRKGGSSQFYVNGVATGVPSTLPPPTPSGVSLVGGSPVSTEFFIGDVDEVRLSMISSSFNPSRHLLYTSATARLLVQATINGQTVSPTDGTLNLGESQLNAQTSTSMWVVNDNTIATSVTAAVIDGANAEDFSLVPSPEGALQPFRQKGFQIAFKASALGPRTATLRITCADPLKSPEPVTLTATGTPSPDISVETSDGVFNNTPSTALRFHPGQRDQTLTIRNTGAGTLTGLSFSSISDGFTADPALPPTLAAGASFTTTLSCWLESYAPSASEIRIGSNDLDENPFVVPVEYQGAAHLEASSSAVAVLEDRTDAIGFNRAAQQVITLRNSGAMPMIGTVALEGAHAADFSPATNSFNVAPNTTRTITLNYVGTTPGPRSARARITSNDPQNPTLAIALVTNAGSPVLEVRRQGATPVTFLNLISEYGIVEVGQQVTQTFEVANRSSITQNNLSFVKEGPHPDDFVVSALSRTSLAAGAKATFVINFKPTAPGDRRAVIRLKRGTLDDTAFQVLGIGMAKPALEVEPVGSIILKIGEILSLDPLSVVGVTLDSNVSFRWLKNGKLIEGSSPALELTTTSLADAGTYSLKMTNAVGSTILNYAVVKMLNPVITGPAQAAVGKPLTLKVQTAGPGLSYQWFDDGTVLEGKTTPTITIVPTEGTHQYYCVVSGGGEQTTEILTVAAISQKPVLADPGPQEMAANGLLVLQLQQTSPDIAPLSFGMSGVPGLRISPTGEVLGTVSKPGNYVMKFWGTNVAGTGPVISVPLVVKPLPSVLLGTFAGTFTRHAVLNDNLGGRFEITSTSAATYSGLVQLGKRSWRISGKFELADLTQLTTLDKVLSSGPDFSVQMELSITNYEDSPAIAMRLTSQQNGSSSVSDGMSKVRPSAELVGRYTTTVGFIPSQITDATPDGMGFATIVVDAAGNVTSSGRLSDGTPFTNATIVSTSDSPMFQLLYGGRGSLLGFVGCSRGDAPQAECGGLFSWLREPNAQDQAYPEGWSANDVILAGAKYVAPAAGHRILELPAISPNAQLVFSDGDLGATPLTQPVSFGVGNYRLPSVSNALAGFWVSVNASTGQITGGFDDRRPVTIAVFPAPPAPRYAFYGLLVPTFEQGAGVLVRTSPSPGASRAAKMLLEPLSAAP
ncbi:MAG: choice-of-anchor D domain-containing protein [Verrucomicrobiaceae bacterium]|nr:choice-of-anchor D domain-containing protein [Verrucomicrobiaceae bacterium]